MENKVKKISPYYGENMPDYFDAAQEFFFIDSENLDKVTTKMYGFAVQNSGIYEDSNMTKEAALGLDGVGVYIYIERKGEKIKIRQDYNGSFGIYMFESGSYWALSSSFFLLLDNIKRRFPLSLNRDFANHIMLNALSTHSYSETAVNEIRLIGKDAIINIDAATCEIAFENENYQTAVLPPDSKEGVAVLDRWVNKWAAVFRSLKAKSGQITVDLSGGFDSRIMLLLLLQSGINLNEINIHSINDDLHTHTEDWQIASKIAKHYGFQLNSGNLSEDVIYYSLKDIINIAFYTKMTFHKQMNWKYFKNVNKIFRITGNGGETLREYWNVPADEFIKNNAARSMHYTHSLAQEMHDSTVKILTGAFKAVGEKYNIADKNSPDYPLYTYCETRSRSHFGKGSAEAYFSNILDLNPYFDPDLRKLKRSCSECADNNLLMALMYVRYCPELLSFSFEGGRKIDEKTIIAAQKINERFPLPQTQPIETATQEFNIVIKDEKAARLFSTAKNSPAVKKGVPDQYLTDVFNSASFRKLFATYFDEEIYAYAKASAQVKNFYPLSECYAVIGLTKVIEDITLSAQAQKPTLTQDLERFIAQNYYVPDDSALLVARLENFLTARFDIKFDSAGGCEIADISDPRVKIKKPAWLRQNECGYIIESHCGALDLTIKFKTQGKFSLALRGCDVRASSGERVPYWIDLENVECNGKPILAGRISVCHDKVFNYSKDVNAQETLTLHAEWGPHYTPEIYMPGEKAELKRKLQQAGAKNHELKLNLQQAGAKNNELSLKLRQLGAENHAVNARLQSFKNYITARFDIKLEGEGADFEIAQISDEMAKKTTPGWIQNGGAGYVIESAANCIDIKLKINATGKLQIKLRGEDAKDEDSSRVPYWLNFQNITLNGRQVITMPRPACYSEPISSCSDVTAGDEINLHAEWLPCRADFAAAQEAMRLKAELAGLGQKNSALKNKNSAIKKEIAALQAEKDRLKKKNNARKKAIAALENQTDELKKENHATSKKLGETENKNAELSRANKAQKKEIEALYSSASMRLGRALTFPARRLKAMFKKLRRKKTLKK
ncbi:MAG: hypothetical protein LUH82_06455 [Clostridiales bacterium]|nr:hypothetical protein [Clostridiales bacterium]